VVYDVPEEEDYYSSSTWVLPPPAVRIFGRFPRGYGAVPARQGIRG